MELPDGMSCPITEDPSTTSAGHTSDRGAIEAATVSWLESFSNNVEEVLEPLQTQLMAVLSQVDKGILVGREFRVLQDVQKKATGLCKEAIAKLEALSDSLPEYPLVNHQLQRLLGMTAKLQQALQATRWSWDTLSESVADFLQKSLHPTTALDMQVSYKMAPWDLQKWARRPRTVDIVLPASRIANTVLFMIGESVGRATGEAMEEMARAITMVEAAANAVLEELNPGEDARSYSSVHPYTGKLWESSRLDGSRSWVPGQGNSVQPGAEWAQLDLGQVLRVYGVVTQGYPDGEWVTQYEVHTSTDGSAFQRVADGPFHGNVDGVERATARFLTAVEARYIRILPTSWEECPAFRFGVLVET